MFNKNVINVDYKGINEAIEKVFEPVVIVMNSNTLMVFVQGAEDNPDAKITVEEDGFEEIVTYNNIPISVNPVIPFGQVIVK